MPSVATLAQPPASLPCTTAVNFLGPPALCSFCLPLIVFRISNSVIICTVLVERVDCGVRQMGWLSIATQEISPTPVWAGTLYTYAVPLPPGQPGAAIFEGLARQSLHPGSPVWLSAELGPRWLLVGGGSEFTAPGATW